MTKSINSASPLIIQTEVGQTVFYKERFLYSKHNPLRQIEKTISLLKKTEKTLFIFASPVLGFCASSFIEELPASSFLLFLECDELLGKVFEEHFFNNFRADIKQKNRVGYICEANLDNILRYVEKFTQFNFRRVDMVRCSAGCSLYESFYSNALHSIEEAVATFWKNRITLIEMGRLYTRNIFKWLHHLVEDSKKKETKRFKLLKKNSIEKPIIMCAAGPSLAESCQFILKNREKFFVLVVDVALPTVLDAKIIPDAIVLLEGQYWVEQAFFCASGAKIDLFASITSTPRIYNILQGDVFLYAIEFAKFSFLERLRQYVPSLPFFIPLGSVGLQALQIATYIAKEGQPIFHTGLDFSYSEGFTHAISSMQYQNALIENGRLHALYNATSIFPPNAIKIEGKKGKTVWTSQILLSYANIYRKYFFHMCDIFDVGSTGLNLRSEILNVQDLCLKDAGENEESFCQTECKNISNVNTHLNIQNILRMLQDEVEQLKELKDMLIGELPFEACKVLSILKTADYLYLHFADFSYLTDKAMLSISFLKRVRIEVEYFLKLINLCI